MLLISDANIIIDFDCCGLLEQLFRLDHEIGTPDLLYEQELKTRHPELPELGLKVMELSGNLIEQAWAMKQAYPAPSMNDLFTLCLAKDKASPLLTGDKQLRLAAETEQVQVKGSLWLAEQMVVKRLSSVEQMADAFDQMRDLGRRLPWSEVDRLLAKYRDNEK